MKYLYLIVMIFILTSCTYREEKEDYNYLDDNSLRLIRNNNDTSILINDDNNFYLLLLGKQNIDIEVDYLIKLSNQKTDIKTKEEYILTNDLTINNITFKKNDKIEIFFNNHNFCIYINSLDQDNYSNCDFVYLYDPHEDFYITLNSNLSVLFYHSYTKFNYKFLYHLATVWIDSYTLSEKSYTTVTITKESFEILGSKIRGKAIHKRVKT